ncbi:hypothetical protein PCE1_002945 [Barthelona sp. PCE]
MHRIKALQGITLSSIPDDVRDMFPVPTGTVDSTDFVALNILDNDLLPLDIKNQKLNLYFALDTSASMNRTVKDGINMFQMAVLTLRHMLTTLHTILEEGKVAKVSVHVVAFKEDVKEELYSGRLKSNMSSLFRKLEDIEIGGLTDLFDAVNESAKYLNTKAINSSIVLSDGIPTEHYCSFKDIVSNLSNTITNFFHTFIGFKTQNIDFNELCEEMNAWSYTIQDSEHMSLAVDEILNGLVFSRLRNVVFSGPNEGLQFFCPKTGTWAKSLDLKALYGDEDIAEHLSFMLDRNQVVFPFSISVIYERVDSRGIYSNHVIIESINTEGRDIELIRQLFDDSLMVMLLNTKEDMKVVRKVNEHSRAVLMSMPESTAEVLSRVTRRLTSLMEYVENSNQLEKLCEDDEFLQNLNLLRATAADCMEAKLKYSAFF